MQTKLVIYRGGGQGTLSRDLHRAARSAGAHRYHFKETVLTAQALRTGNLAAAARRLGETSFAEYDRKAYERLARAMDRFTPGLVAVEGPELHGVLSAAVVLFANLRQDEVLGEPSGRSAWDETAALAQAA